MTTRWERELEELKRDYASIELQDELKKKISYYNEDLELKTFIRILKKHLSQEAFKNFNVFLEKLTEGYYKWKQRNLQRQFPVNIVSDSRSEEAYKNSIFQYLEKLDLKSALIEDFKRNGLKSPMQVYRKLKELEEQKRKKQEALKNPKLPSDFEVIKSNRNIWCENCWQDLNIDELVYKDENNKYFCADYAVIKCSKCDSPVSMKDAREVNDLEYYCKNCSLDLSWQRFLDDEYRMHLNKTLTTFFRVTILDTLKGSILYTPNFILFQNINTQLSIFPY